MQVQQASLLGNLEDHTFEARKFADLTGTLLSYYIFQLITVGEVSSVADVIRTISFREDIQKTVTGLLKSYEEAGVINIDSNGNISVKKHYFRFDLRKANDGQLLPELFRLNSMRALEELENGDRNIVAFTISEDNETKAEVKNALEDFRVAIRKIGERAVSRKATGVRFIGVTSSLMIGADYSEHDIQNQRNASELLRSTAHDIKAPLAALELLQTEVADKMGVDCSELYSVSLSRIQNIILNVLNPKPNTDKSSIYDVVSMIDKIVAEKNLVYGKKVNIAVKANSTQLQIDSIKELELSRILHNLVQNAIESMSDEINSILIKLSSVEGFVQIIVRDTGKGIPEEVLESIKNGVSVSTKKNGNGIGLVSTIQKIKDASGSVTISSKENIGTEITIMLPMIYQ